MDKMVNKNFWKKKKVLITGHTGFKGSWLSLVLNELGCLLYGYSLPPISPRSIFNTNKIEKIFIKSKFADLNDKKELKKFIKISKPKIVFHLAAQPIVIESYKNPINTFRTNIMGTANLCDILSKTNSTEKIIIITSDKCYLNYDKNIKFFKETDPLGGFDPYSASKAGTEIIAQSYQSSYFTKKKILCATARAGNVIGGGDDAKHRIFPDIVKSIISKKKLIIRNPKAIRPWQHVLEPIYGYIKLAEKMNFKNQKKNNAWNFGPFNSSVKNVLDLVKEVNKIQKINFSISKNKKKLHESQFLGLDISKSKNKLKWKPKLTFFQNVKYTIDWYKAKNKNEITKKQIKAYFKL